MKINKNIFKAYDIRGVYPGEINEDAVYKIGQAFVAFLGKRAINPVRSRARDKPATSNGVKKKGRLQIVVSRDNRLSSPSLRGALVKGIREAGADVTDIGLAPTPMFYFAVAHHGFDGGIQISASHNPPQYNGLKIVRERAIPVARDSGLGDIQSIIARQEDFAIDAAKNRSNVLKNIRTSGKGVPPAQRSGLTRKNLLRDYIHFQLKDFDTVKLRKLKIVVDTANAVPGFVLAAFFKKIGLEYIHLNAKPDGRFPSHPPDPLRPKNLRPIQDAVIKHKADLGASFDGDGDRVIFCDENGKVISSDTITALIAAIILRERPGSKILYDIRSGRATKEAIRSNGGIPVVSKVGHSFIKAKMRKEDIRFGGEFSGHFYHKDHYFCEVPLWVLLVVLREMEARRAALSELLSPFRQYFQSGEINFEIEDKEGIMKNIERSFRGGKVSRLDGLRVDFRDWWFLVRKSNTEPVLRLAIEAKTKKLLEQKKKELIRFLKP